jgi:exopolysaccharide biosynthesis protein
MKREILTLSFLLTFTLIWGQYGTAFPVMEQPEWKSRSISGGITFLTTADSLFNSAQAIYVAEIDTAGGAFEFGVAATVPPLATSAFAAQENAIVAVNATFFNMQEGYNVHYVRVNDSIVAATEEQEFGVRATGLFTAEGEAADISMWSAEKEDARLVITEDALVSGPLLLDDGLDLHLDTSKFNVNRHPRTMVGLTGNGHLLFVVVDGRQPGYAEGMSLFELRALARSLGCTDALNLDGGGSSTMVIAGEGGNGVVNRPSGKVERPVPSILFVRSRTNNQ